MGIFDQENISSVSQVEKDRLFETVHKTEDSSRNYFKILGIVGLCVLVIGAVVYYLTLPGVGSRVRRFATIRGQILKWVITGQQESDAAGITQPPRRRS